MSAAALTAWAALGLVPLAAIIGWFLRRFAKGSLIRRMRPHVIVGFGALILAVMHFTLTIGRMAGANSTGIWLATLALCGLGFQAFLGSNLTSPGAYRLLLRRWHVMVFGITFAFIIGHIILNAAFIPQ